MFEPDSQCKGTRVLERSIINMRQLANILSGYPVATQPPPCSSAPPPTSASSAASPTEKKRLLRFTRFPQWVEAAIEQHAPSPWVCAIATRLALKLFDRADNHTDVTRTLTQPQLARLLEVSVDSIQDATNVLRASGVCTTTHVYAQRRRIGMRYTMHRHAVSKTAGKGLQDLPDLRTSKKSSCAPSAPPAPPPSPICPIAETPWLFDAPIMAEMGEALPSCQCHVPAPEVLELEPEPAAVPQRELPLEADPAPPARPSDGQLRLPAYMLLDRQPALSDAALLAAVAPILAARYPGARVSAERLTRQLRIVRQRHDPRYRQKQHRREQPQPARRTTRGGAGDRAVNATWDRYWAARYAAEDAADEAARAARCG